MWRRLGLTPEALPVKNSALKGFPSAAQSCWLLVDLSKNTKYFGAGGSWRSSFCLLSRPNVILRSVSSPEEKSVHIYRTRKRRMFGWAIEQKSSVLSLGCLIQLTVAQKKHKIHLGTPIGTQQLWAYISEPAKPCLNPFLKPWEPAKPTPTSPCPPPWGLSSWRRCWFSWWGQFSVALSFCR